MSAAQCPDEARALRLAQEIAQQIDAQALPPEVFLAALAKVVGHAVTIYPGQAAENALTCIFVRARRQMQISRLAAQLHAAGLGVFMPVKPQ